MVIRLAKSAYPKNAYSVYIRDKYSGYILNKKFFPDSLNKGLSTNELEAIVKLLQEVEKN